MKKLRMAILGSAIALPSFWVSSQDVTQLGKGNEINLSVSTEVGSIDNFLFDSVNEKSTSYFTVTPELLMQVQSDRQRFAFAAKTQLNKFQEFEQDDHTNVWLSPSYIVKFADNKTLYVNADFQQLYEMRGTGLTLGNGSSQIKGDEKKQTDLAAGYIFGTTGSTAKLQFELGAKDGRYKTRRHETKLLDNNSVYANVSFDYLLSGGTYLASDFRFQRIEFENQPLFDKNKSMALFGIKWPASEISEVSFLLGYQKIAFKENDFADDDGIKWRFSWRWSPVESTTINLSSERDFAEANRLTNSYRLIDRYAIQVNSKISEFISISADIGINYQNVIYQDRTSEEDYWHSGLKLNYLINERISAFLGYEYNDLSSTEELLEYQRNSFSLGINVSI